MKGSVSGAKGFVSVISALVIGGVIGFWLGGYTGLLGVLGFAPPSRHGGREVHFVVLNGGGVFFVPDQGDKLSWYPEGKDQTDGTAPGTTDNRVAVTFQDSPCSGGTPGQPHTVKGCQVVQTAGSHAYDCSNANRVCQDPGVGPGSKNGGSMMQPPNDPGGQPITVTVMCTNGTATVHPTIRKVHAGDTVRWLSNEPNFTILLSSRICNESSVNQAQPVCNVIRPTPLLPLDSSVSYAINVPTCATHPPTGTLVVEP